MINRPTKQIIITAARAAGVPLDLIQGGLATMDGGTSPIPASPPVMVLCFSRRMYLEFTWREAQEHFLECHQHAFEYFLGATHQLIVDNCEVAVTRHERGQAPIFNPRYLDFARHHGCEVRACNPHSPHEKGRAEKAVDYVKRNFLAGLTLTSLEALNAGAKLCLSTVANVRQHGTIGQAPEQIFAEEKTRLRPLPAERHDVATVHAVRANRSFRVAFDANKSRRF